MTVDLILSIVYTQIVLIPILGAIYLATKNERKRISVIQSTPKMSSKGIAEFIKDISKENKRTLQLISSIKAPSRIKMDGKRGRDILNKIRTNRKPFTKRTDI
jgi:hypothetical protein